ncbi:MAG TPA: hypothetical protein DCW68_07495 [Rhodospirillaceae bacterium]|nr:hypothetical protein [Rhodospirillaceae bacterium]
MRKTLLATTALALFSAPALADTYPVTLRVTDSTGATADQSFNIDVSDSGGDSGWLTIPASTLPGSGRSVPSFRVMKHLARLVGGVATSTPVGAPSYPSPSYSFFNARTTCQALGEGYDLITLSQHLAIAHNALAQPANWTGLAPGNGQFIGGYSTIITAANADDAQGYAGVTGAQNRRTWLLSNGSVIWDLGGFLSSSGPVGQWVTCDSGRPGCLANGTISSSWATFFGTAPALASEWSTINNLPPENSDIKPGTYTSAQNVGRIERVWGTSISGLTMGNWTNNVGGVFGIYATATTATPMFRCAGPIN